MFLFGDTNHLQTHQSCDLRLFKCQTGIYDVLLNTFIAGSHLFSMHEIVEISDKM